MGSTVPSRREPFQGRVLVGRDPVRNRPPRDRARLWRRIEAEALRGRPRQVSPIACQLGPALALTAPPPMIVFPFMSQIEVWPLVF